MALKKRFEIYHICKQIENVIGRRYNIRPDLDEGDSPDMPGYCNKETIAGLFRAWRLNEIHLQLVIAVNRLQVVNFEQLMKVTAMKSDDCYMYLDECIRFGLLCENTPQDKDSSIVYDKLYFVDTGGIFALEETGIAYNNLLYTSGIDQRINICRRNIFVVENGYKEVPRGVIFFENIVGDSQPPEEGVVLYDSSIALFLGVVQEVNKYLADLNRSGVKVYDLYLKKYGIDNLS